MFPAYPIFVTPYLIIEESAKRVQRRPLSDYMYWSLEDNEMG